MQPFDELLVSTPYLPCSLCISTAASSIECHTANLVSSFRIIVMIATCCKPLSNGKMCASIDSALGNLG